MQALADVLQNYLVTKQALYGKAYNTGIPDQSSLTKTLPDFFKQILQKLNRLQDFKVEES